MTKGLDKIFVLGWMTVRNYRSFDYITDINSHLKLWIIKGQSRYPLQKDVKEEKMSNTSSNLPSLK